MRKKKTILTSHEQKFIALLDIIKPQKHRFDVYSDWLILASASLYSWKKDKSIEDEYLQITKQYTSSEHEQLSQLLVITIEALEEKIHDFLGEVFTIGELSNERIGQFFTPFHISEFLARVMIGDKNCETGRILRIIDPCCGAGGMLIAGALVLKEHGINYQKDAFFVGVDIDHRCARMTFIQLSLLAVPALIVCGNILTSEIFWQRETICFYDSNMHNKINLEEVIDYIFKQELREEDTNGT